jgi:hypothetical protein
MCDEHSLIRRYVFEQYDSTRGPTLFQPKDRLFLTRSIMLRFMDLDILNNYNAIKVARVICIKY